jgi:hypothetical protein
MSSESGGARRDSRNVTMSACPQSTASCSAVNPRSCASSERRASRVGQNCENVMHACGTERTRHGVAGSAPRSSSRRASARRLSVAATCSSVRPYCGGAERADAAQSGCVCQRAKRELPHAAQRTRDCCRAGASHTFARAARAAHARRHGRSSAQRGAARRQALHAPRLARACSHAPPAPACARGPTRGATSVPRASHERALPPWS